MQLQELEIITQRGASYFVLFTKYYLDDQIRKDEVCGAYSNRHISLVYGDVGNRNEWAYVRNLNNQSVSRTGM
jgi:hypothetical protein